jgi:ribosomal protein L11 methyltransferase
MSSGEVRDDRVVVVVDCAEVIAELVSERLFAFGASAVATEDVGSTVRSTADIHQSCLTALEELDFPGGDLVWRVVDPGTAWMDAWREHARSWTAGPFVVRPPWIDADGDDSDGPESIQLVVDPSHSFGSGSHPTTRACLELLGRMANSRATGHAGTDGQTSGAQGGRAIDVGMGSGILGVAALKSGFDTVVGIDIDPNAVEQAPVVAGANGVGDRFEVVNASVEELASAPDPQAFDLVLANLLIPVIEELGGSLVRLCAPGGSLIVSGLLADQRARAVVALVGTSDVAPLPGSPTSALAVVDELLIDGWMAMRLARGPA